MTTELAPLGIRYSFVRGTIRVGVEGFTSEDWARRPGATGGNTAHWIVGHIAATRRHLVRKLGARLPEEPWEAAFGRRAEPDGTEAYPEPDSLLKDIDERGKEITRLVAEISEEGAQERWGDGFPDGGKTVADGVHFFLFHETYHAGQLGLIRRLFGKPGIK